MNHLLIYLFLLASSIPTSLAFDVTSSALIHQDENNREFILINEGESVDLICENFQGDHHWVLPNNTDLKGFDKAEQASRLKIGIGHDQAEQKLTISNAKVTDTGLYECHYDGNKEDDIYVFVRGPQFFLKPAVEVHSVDPEEKFTIPCRSTWPPLDEEGTVELYLDGVILKESSKHYDPRVGFEMTPKLLNGMKLTNGVRFECKYNSYSVTFIIRPQPKSNTEDYKLRIEQITEFPHVGGPLEYDCVVEGPNAMDLRYMHKLETECPTCVDNSTHKNNWIDAKVNEARNKFTVFELTSQSTGEYWCKWRMEKKIGGKDVFVPMNNLNKMIIVSDIKEQIKIVNRTDSNRIVVQEGQPLTIFARFRTYPANHGRATWKRMSMIPPKETYEEAVNLISDGQIATATSHPSANDTLETLTIHKATLSMSGTYLIDIDVDQKASRQVLWNVTVLRRKMEPHIQIASQYTSTLFNQKFYKVGTELRVICYVEALPHPEVSLMMRKLDPRTDWQQVVGATKIIGTTHTGLTMKVTVTDDVEYKCQADRENQTSVFERVEVRVTDSEADATAISFKPDSPTSKSERTDQMYEGDRIELDCHVPKTDDVSMGWLFEKSPANLPETTTVAAHTKHLIATIDKVTSAQSGMYTCVVRDAKNDTVTMEFNRIIDVVKTTKPFLRGPPIDPNVEVKYLEKTQLFCPMDGTPEPQYKWFKDGVEITDHTQVHAKKDKLHITRAAAQDVGTYVCRAENRAGTTELTYKLKVKNLPKTLSGWSIFFIVMAFLVLIGCLIAAFILYTRQKKKSKQQAHDLQTLYEQFMRGSESEAPLLPTHGKVSTDWGIRVRRTAYDPKYEIDMKNLVLLGALGSGQFGSVRKGQLSRGAPVSDSAAYRGPALTVAVKSPSNGSNPEHQKALIDELKMLIAIDNIEEAKHPNVLSLVGAVTKNMKDGQLYVVFEMCENGDLKTFLQRYKGELKDKFLNELKENKRPAVSNDDYLVPNNQVTVQYASQGDSDWAADQERDRLLGDPKSLSTSDLISFSMQIASGMDFLAGVSCIHRDLAARNCLLNANKVVKIADFGMAKNEDKGYYRMQKTNVMVPYRWMAPESMEDHTFTVESDIWSYGIVLYEIFTLGSQPYPGVPNNNLHEHLNAGQRNPIPALCHPDIYNLMQETWDKVAHNRPSFGRCSSFMRDQLRLLNPEILDATDKELVRNAAQIAQFDQFRGPGATAVLDEQELAALFAGQSSPVTNGHNHDEETGERIYIKELRR